MKCGVKRCVVCLWKRNYDEKRNSWRVKDGDRRKEEGNSRIRRWSEDGCRDKYKEGRSDERRWGDERRWCEEEEKEKEKTRWCKVINESVKKFEIEVENVMKVIDKMGSVLVEKSREESIKMIEDVRVELSENMKLMMKVIEEVRKELKNLGMKRDVWKVEMKKRRDEVESKMEEMLLEGKLNVGRSSSVKLSDERVDVEEMGEKEGEFVDLVDERGVLKEGWLFNDKIKLVIRVRVGGAVVGFSAELVGGKRTAAVKRCAETIDKMLKAKGVLVKRVKVLELVEKELDGWRRSREESKRKKKLLLKDK